MKVPIRQDPSTYSLFPELEIAPNSTNLTLSPERLSTNTTTYQHPVHRWFNFIAGFSPEFVHQCCEAAQLEPGSLLLDPFAGCATAPLVACQRGVRAIGFEPHPVFARIGSAKLPDSRATQHVSLIESAILEGIQQPSSIELLPKPAQLFLAKLFPQGVLEELLGAREALRQRQLLDSDLAFLVLSRIVDLCSHSQTDGVYKAPTSIKRNVSPPDACHAVCTVIRTDLMACNDQSYASLGRIYCNSSEDMEAVPDASVSIVVTSPPYLNNFDYAEMTRMYLYFWQIADSWADITDKVRSKLIVNTTTALKGHKDKQQLYRGLIPASLHQHIDPLVQELSLQGA